MSTVRANMLETVDGSISTTVAEIVTKVTGTDGAHGQIEAITFLTQDEYDAIAVKDPNTLYFITG